MEAAAQGGKPIFRLNLMRNIFAGALAVSALVIVTPILYGTDPLVIALISVFCAAYLGILMKGKDYLFYDDKVVIRPVYGRRTSVSYSQLTLSGPFDSSSRGGTKAVLEPKDESSGIKPITITSSPRNKSLDTDLVSWLRTKFEPPMPQFPFDEYLRKMAQANLITYLPFTFMILALSSLSGSPLLALALTIPLSLAAVAWASVQRKKVDRKYRQTTASGMDYFLAALPMFFVTAYSASLLAGYLYLYPNYGVLAFVLANSMVVGAALLLARFPIFLRFGRRPSPITAGPLLSSLKELAGRMGVEDVGFYSVAWKGFKLANAVEMGIRKPSVYISDYILEAMTPDETRAVVAHELAHAKRRHVAKMFVWTIVLMVAAFDATFIFPSSVSTPSYPATASLVSLLAPLATIVLLLLGSRVALSYQKKFELEADALAVKAMGETASLEGALTKLATLNGVPMNRGSPTHPSSSRRIQIIERMALAGQLLGQPAGDGGQ